MNETTTTRNESADWCLKLRNLRDNIKQRVLDNSEALSVAEEIKEHYISIGIKPVTDVLNAHIHLCKTDDQARAVLAAYTEFNVPYSTATFNILISISGNFLTASSYYHKMLEYGVQPNTITLNSFISLCQSLGQAREIIRLMRKHRVQPGTPTYNALLTIAPGDKVRFELIQEMELNGIVADVITYNTLISRSSGFQQAMLHFAELKAKELIPSINSYVSLLKKAGSTEEINMVKELLAHSGVATNNAWKNLLEKKEWGN
ncbi:MAG: hypothetical protein CVU11_09905 [Bacteroidetes bacterium HGW-Bacteroidetes-6]|jgi:hypothetical protein|nr:MAG: hypothetical protein CVU11_09905 [Bacteroidetes bacterium HGW-Bacteroidetes-6]